MSESVSSRMWRRLTGKKAPDEAATPKEKPKPPATPASAPTADFSGVTNPKGVIERRLAEAERGMKKGGKVRGSGCAMKGHGKGKMR